MELSKKVVIVTGGAGGIGRVLVNQLIAEGATVGIFDLDRNELSELFAPDVASSVDHCFFRSLA